MTRLPPGLSIGSQRIPARGLIPGSGPLARPHFGRIHGAMADLVDRLGEPALRAPLDSR